MRNAGQLQDQLFALIEEAVTEKRRAAQKHARDKMALILSVEFVSAMLGSGLRLNFEDAEEQARHCAIGASYSHALIDANIGPLDPPKEEAPDAGANEAN